MLASELIWEGTPAAKIPRLLEPQAALVKSCVAQGAKRKGGQWATASWASPIPLPQARGFSQRPHDTTVPGWDQQQAITPPCSLPLAQIDGLTHPDRRALDRWLDHLSIGPCLWSWSQETS
jgi:hypothetical protein